ncbi:MAG: hypothetical protein V4516_07595, partial [Pseudomonadota bacterium]
MDIKRRLARAVSVLAVAILLGHVVQTMAETGAPRAVTSAPATDPKIIVPVAAGPEAAVAPSLRTPVAAPEDDKAMMADKPAMVAPASAEKTPDSLPRPMMAGRTPTITSPASPPAARLATASPTATEAPSPPVAPAPQIITTTAPEPSIVPKAMEVLLQPQQNCENAMDLSVVADAIIEVSLMSPCRPGERLVLRHGPLAITTRTTAQGSVFLKIPALDAAGEVSLRFADGSVIDGTVAVPDLAKLRRFAVQWMDRDTFGVNAFEGGSGYGGAGHISAANPGKLPLTGTADSGYLMILGDAEATPAMLAEVYTYPAGSLGPV